MTTTGTGRGAVTDGHTGWDCPNGASLIAGVTGPGLGTLPAYHGCIYICTEHQAQAEARITAAGHQPDVNPAPPAHRWDPWPCGHITTHGSSNGPQLAKALTTPAVEDTCPDLESSGTATEPPTPTPSQQGSSEDKAARLDVITRIITSRIPGAQPANVRVIITDRHAPDVAHHTWEGLPRSLAGMIHTALFEMDDREQQPPFRAYPADGQEG